MNIKMKVRRKTTSTGTPASGNCEYSYNLVIKIKDISSIKQADNIYDAVLQALKGAKA